MLAPLAAHIQSLKKRLLIIAVTLGVAFATAFAYSSEMVAWLNRPFPNQLVFYGPTEALFASIKVSFLAGIILSLPIIFYQEMKEVFRFPVSLTTGGWDLNCFTLLLHWNTIPYVII